MNLWKLVEPNRLVKLQAPLPEPQEGLVRVRVAKVLVTRQDAETFSGETRIGYPIVPGRYAVGFVVDEGVPGFPKNTRVLLHGYRPVPDGGVEKRDFSADDYVACGRTVDGFLSDFVLVSPDDMSALPASVSDERALLLHQVAAAKEITDKLDVQKGTHIAVVGADLIGILTCQLLIYQQAAPILVDRDPNRLAFARSCGVYYTFRSGPELVDSVASVTGGRLASGAVYAATALGNSTYTPFQLTARDGRVVYFATSSNKVNVDLGIALRKHLCVYCVTHGVKYLKTAINLMANRAVDPSPFRANAVPAADTKKFFSSYNDRPDRDYEEISYIDLLQ